MNTLLWVLQVPRRRSCTGASGRHESLPVRPKASEGGSRPFWRACRGKAWTALGILELVLARSGLIRPRRVPLAAGAHGGGPATVLAIESLVFVGVHAKYREITPHNLERRAGRFSWAFLAYGRMVLKPIS